MCSLAEEWRTAGYVEIDLELSLFLDRHGRTPLQRDILTFFALNPHARDPASALAERLGRQYSAVARELDDMALLGVLEKYVRDNLVVYGLRRDPALLKIMERLRRHLEIAGKTAGGFPPASTTGPNNA
ncbi:MAG: hypothetical protein ACUVWB_10460 [Anaerolineae bacterium]